MDWEFFTISFSTQGFYNSFTVNFALLLYTVASLLDKPRRSMISAVVRGTEQKLTISLCLLDNDTFGVSECLSWCQSVLGLHSRYLTSFYLFQYIIHHSLIHSLFNKSFTSTFSKSEIRIKVSKSGWQVLVHHLEMVAWSLPNISANHLFECLVTANIIFNLFTYFFAILL